VQNLHNYASGCLNWKMAHYYDHVLLIIATLGSTLFGIVFFMLVFLNEVVRHFVSLIFRYKYKNKIQLVTDGADAVHRTGRTMVVGIMKTDKPVSPKEFVACYKDLISKQRDLKTGQRVYEKLEKVLIKKFGYACWATDDNFGIEKQCRVLTKKVNYKANLEKLIRQLEQDMGEDKPQWEVVIVPQYCGKK